MTSASTEPGDGIRIRPVYLVLGISDARRDATETMLAELRDTLSARPAVGNRVRVGIVEFGDRAAVRLPLSDLLDPLLVLPRPPDTGEGNAFAPVFELLHELCDDDATALAEDATVERPLCWLITDRPPTDDVTDRRRAFAELTGHAGYPYVVPCATTDVPVAELTPIVHPATGGNPMTAYLASPAAGLRGLGSVIAMGIVDTGLPYDADDEGVGVELPHPERLPAGVRSTTTAPVS